MKLEARIESEVNALMAELEQGGAIDDTNREKVKRFAIATARKVPEFRGEPEPTYICPECRDTGQPSCTAGFIQMPSKLIDGREYDRTWFCGCLKGQSLESAHWLDAVYPALPSGKRRLNRQGQKRFEAYLASSWPFARNMGRLFSELVAKLTSEGSIS